MFFVQRANANADQLAPLVAAAFERPLVHPRVEQQGFWTSPTELSSYLNEALPAIVGYPGRRYHSVTCLVDWDHRLPSESLLVRLFVTYQGTRDSRLKADIGQISERIVEDNLFPEFDVPDYNAVVGDEVYVATATVADSKPSTAIPLDSVRFYCDWRREVERKLLKQVLDVLGQDATFKKALAFHDTMQLGDPIVVGWAPPCLSGSKNWSVEVWVVTAFEGRFGKAQVFMVDHVELRVVRSYQTEIQVSA